MFYFYRAMVWARKAGISCTTDSARMLCNKYLCSRPFSESDFTTAEGYTSTEWQFYVAWNLLHSHPHNHWSKSSMGINIWIFLKDGKPASSSTEWMAN
jgi:hypothetical protein